MCSGADWAVIFDGATAPTEVDSGCIHDVPWLVHHLAASITTRPVLPDGSSLADILAAAIKDTADAHAGTCDLANPDSPSSTVSILRVRDDSLDYLTSVIHPSSCGTRAIASPRSRTTAPRIFQADAPTRSS